LHASNKKAVSTLILILLIAVAAIIGGLVTYMFTIAAFVDIPEGTTVTITNIYLDKQDASSFKIGVLNPSFSPANATITRIAVGLKGASELYDIVETDPAIENGIIIPKGESLNITCFEVQKDGANVTWGKVAGDFAGESIIVYLFSSDAQAANMETILPYAKIDISETVFDSSVSFGEFNATLMNDNSEINLTINQMIVSGIELTENNVSPNLPVDIGINESIHFAFNASWYPIMSTNTSLTVYTSEGYVFSQNLQLPGVFVGIQNVAFDKDATDYFNVTIYNLEQSANYANVTEIVGTLENETTIEQDYPSIGITPNSTETFKFNWTWKEYRGKNIDFTAYLLQDFETAPFTGTTPASIIVKVLNENETFDLKDKEHFNITVQNHGSSLEAINVTGIAVKETGEVINGTMANPKLPYGPIEPRAAEQFNCGITNWTNYAGESLTLTVYVVASETLEEQSFEFVFTLPAAELNITGVTRTEMGATKYLNITARALDYSVWNLTISEIKITLQNQSVVLEQTFFKDQIIITPSSEAILLCAYDWIEYPPENITITVITAEGIEASWQGTVP
jgi:hypothetical protein